MKKIKFIRNVELTLEDILLFESDINYSQIWLSNGKKVIVAKTLKQIAEMVKESSFVRVNRQIMLNASHVKHLEMEPKKSSAELSNGLKIIFSRRRATEAHNYIQNYLIN